MEDNLDQTRIAQIRRELENYSTQQLTEIWRQHDLEQWTEEAFAAIRQILTTRPAVQLPAPDEIALAGDHLERAYQYSEAGRLQEALHETKLAIQEDPSSLEAYQTLGNILEDLGDLEGAIQAYRKARYLDRGDESTRADLRRALSKQFQQVALKRQSTEEAESPDEGEYEETGAGESGEEDFTGEETESEALEYKPVEFAPHEPALPPSILSLILIGLATAWVTIAFIIFGLLVYTHLPELLSSSAGDLLDFANPSDKIILLFSGLLWLGLSVFYMRHLVHNDEISQSQFGMIGVGFILLPFISLPVYFYRFIWQPNLDNYR